MADPESRAKRSNARGAKPLKPGNGKERRTPAQLERQEKAFTMSVVDCKTVRAIAKELDVTQQTVIADIRHEFARRSAENESRREHELTSAIALYQGVIAKAVKKSDLYDTLLDERAGAKISDHSLEAILKARERIDKLLGLEAPTRVDLGLQTLLDALEPKQL